MEPLLKLDHVYKNFTVRQGMFGQTKTLHAVDDVSLKLYKGETLGLVGESGCGKSTLGKMACGLLPVSSGNIFFHDQPLPPAGARSWAAGKIQMVFQDPASSLDPRMTALESLAEPLIVGKKDRRESFNLAKELLESVGLAGLGNRYPHQFSGGQRQRIAVARAMITRPDIIICDEPVSALDASVQAQILNLLKDMQMRFEPAYFFISHDLAVIGFMCSRILVMYLGQIVETASRDELFGHAAHPYSRALLAAMPKGEATFSQGQDRLPQPLSGELPSPINPPAGCYFHPRCPLSQEICTQIAPPWKQMGPDWYARCHFAGKTAK